MTHMRSKLVLVGLALAIAVTLLAVAGVRKGWVYYLPVDDFMADEGYHAQRVRLHGDVAGENFQITPALLTAEFDLLGTASQVRVQYSGVIPDMFKPEVQVVVEGRMNESGVFEADTLLTKCASKYEPEGDPPPPPPDHQARGNGA